MAAPNFQDIIATRRDGGKHSEADLRSLAFGAAKGEIPDYQLAAWLMAAYLVPLDGQETAWLTKAMAESGERLDLSGLQKPWLDKHSTGGVGDKTTIVLMPLLASCGITMVKMSGRGLGITGGTVDKMESVPGFRMNLTPKQLVAQARKIGIAHAGQTAKLAPADKVLYSIRDATATVSSIPLIVSSILSKKLAGGAEIVVLDVKCGSGAFMPTLPEALRLAEALKKTATLCGLKSHIAVTDMSQPLGRTVGNALEVREAIEVLQGAGGRFRDFCVKMAAHALVAAGTAKDESWGEAIAADALSSGRALAKARQWFTAQGASASVLDDFAGLAVAPVIVEVTQNQAVQGWMQTVEARTVGETVIDLGGGRRTKDDRIDPSVGVECLVAVGDVVKLGQPVFRVHARTAGDAGSAAEKLLGGFRVSNTPVQAPDLVLKEL